jgi:hypothetical protein
VNGAGGALRLWHTSDTRVVDQLSMTCTVVCDEFTEILGVDAFSMRDTQREITDYLVSQGYEPPSRWETQRFDAERGSIVAVHNFAVKKTVHVNDAGWLSGNRCRCMRTIRNDYARSIET